jgi:transposase
LNKRIVIQDLIKRLENLTLRVQQLEKFERENKILKEENAELKKRLSKYETPKNSSNSSIPPSKDENRPQRNKSLRVKSGKSVGGQQGHEGSHLTMQDNPDIIRKHIPDFCNYCGADLSDIPEEFAENRQVIDLPVIVPVCVEHQSYQKRCHCGCITKSPFPSTVKFPVQYGTNTEAMISYLHTRQYLSFSRIQELLNDAYGLTISEGGVHCLLKRFTSKAFPFYEEIKNRIFNSDVVGTDETGVKVNGKKHWFWSWQNKQLTYIVHSANRGIATIQHVFENGLPNSFLNHDRWASHFHCKVKGNQLCTSHLQRDLIYLEDLYQSKWATSLKELLLDALELKKRMLPEDYKKLSKTRDSLEENLSELLSCPINTEHKKAITLQKSLLKYRDCILLFLYQPKVPPDNNGTERSIRNVKVKQKVSGQFKSVKGAEIYAINRSVIDTIIKSKQNVFDGLSLIANFVSD